MAARAARAVGCLVALALAGCADDCTRPSTCPLDAPPTPAQVEACRAQLQSSRACRELRTAASECVLERRVCDARGLTDELATFEACRAELLEATRCETPP